jgi:uncharacterized secreted repeat protein (TIGR03808 family)
MFPRHGLDRRTALGAALLGAATPAAAAGVPGSPAANVPAGAALSATALGLDPASRADQSARLQQAIDRAAAASVPLHLAPGRYLVRALTLRPGTHLVAAPGTATLALAAPGALVTATDADRITLDGLTFDGLHHPLDAATGRALLAFDRIAALTIGNCAIRNAAGHGLRLTRTGGRIAASTIDTIAAAGLFSTDATGLDLAQLHIRDCADNGILVWRTAHGRDATRIRDCRIENIRAASGGAGQNGNAINIYRADGVTAAGNQIADCAFTAIRANESSSVIITGNRIERMGEVAIYAEAADERAGAAGFEGAVISNNLVDRAAAGIVVTNFNNRGRLAVVEGNLVRNLFRRETDPRDKRGEGIAVEADAIVANNIVEDAPTAGLLLGWGPYLRDVVATGNLIRRARIGIAVSADPRAGACLIASNLISGATDGAIRAMDHARPLGEDLTRPTASLPPNLTLAQNSATR